MSCASHIPPTKQQGRALELRGSAVGQLRGQRARPGDPESRRRGRVYHRGGRPGPSCLQSRWGQWKWTGAGARRRDRRRRREGSACQRSPGPGEERAGAGRSAEEERLPRRQQGTGAGRGGGWPAAEACGGGRWRAGGEGVQLQTPTQETAGWPEVPHSGLGGSRLQGILTGCEGGGAHPSAKPCPARVVCRSRGL